MALTDNLVSYWSLDETSGNASDSVGSNTLTNTNSATYSAGKINNGVNFNGGNQYLNKAGNFGIAFGSSYSFGGWVKLNAEIGSGSWYLNQINHAIGGADTSLIRYEYNSGTRRLNFVRYNSGAVNTDTLYNITLGTSNWVHIIGVYNHSTTRTDLYVNGVSVSNNTSAVTAGSTGLYTQGFYVAGDQSGSTAVNCMLDEVGIWSRALTSTEVTELYNSGAGLQYPFSIILDISEALSLTETTTNLRGLVSTISESLSLSETITALKGIAFTVADTLGLVEVFTSTKTLVFTVLDNLGLTELAVEIKKKWTNQTKNTASFTNQTKNTASFTNQTKN